MEKEFIPYEQALALKELGFDEECFSYYNYKEEMTFSSCFNKLPIIMSGKKCAIPTFSQAFRFFREKHGLHHKIDFMVSRGYTYNEAYFFFIKKTEGSTYIEIYDNSFDSKEYTFKEWNKKRKGSYEEAELECLKKLIEIIKNK